jgi:hypothetical protein
MAARECGEAASGVACSVLEEDVMLGFSAQMRHGCVESEPRIGESMAQQAGWAAPKFVSDAPMRLVREREAGEPKQYHVFRGQTMYSSECEAQPPTTIGYGGGSTRKTWHYFPPPL